MERVNRSFTVHYSSFIFNKKQKYPDVVLEKDQPLYHIFKENCPVTKKVLRNMIVNPNKTLLFTELDGMRVLNIVPYAFYLQL